MKFSPAACFSALLLSTGTFLHGETVFEETLDNSPPYEMEGRLPVGFGKILYGKWYSDSVAGLPIVISAEKSFSEPWSLLLENTGTAEEPATRATAWGNYGQDKVSSAAVEGSITLSCAFWISRVDGNETEFASVSIPATGGNPLISAQIGVGGAVVLRVPNSETADVVGSIEAGQWYQLEIVLSRGEATGVNPVLRLYKTHGAARGDLIGSVEGKPIEPQMINRSGFILSNALPGSKVFFDNFLATVQD